MMSDIRAKKGLDMSKRSLTYPIGALLGFMVTTPLTALTYLASQFTDLPFPPFDLFDGMTRLLPGPIITFGIDLMIDTLRALKISVVDTAKIAEQASAVGFFVGGGVILGALFVFASKKLVNISFIRLGMIFGLVLSLPIVVATVTIGQAHLPLLLQVIYLFGAFLVWGASLGWLNDRFSLQDAEMPGEEIPSVKQVSRRQFLIQTGIGAAAITVVGTGLALNERRRILAMMDENPDLVGVPDNMFPNANDPVTPAFGTRDEYTSLEDFYSVFIRTEPSIIDGSTWSLPITGSVNQPLELTLEDLRNNYDPLEQYATLSCISGRVGTSLIGTTLWTGASLQEVLADAGVQPSAKFIHIRSADGFYETVDLDLINSDRRIMLTYEWDGNPLPTGHGFPLRIYIPDRYGMKQPRWITSIEVIDEYIEGYWVERGWDKDAIMQTTSVIDNVATDHIIEEGGQMLVPIGGIAHAGARGISKVEVRVNDGDWTEAKLRSPLSDLTWVIWRYDWPFEEGMHRFEVRCVEADGTAQIELPRGSRPSGSRGIHNLERTI
jgi:DMSO/TMAO reductase YedYZ molybdopterin-dependent catalytic subunit